MNRYRNILVTLILLLSNVAVFAAIDLEAGKKLLQTQCAACHGPDGNTPIPQWPKLAGQYSDYLIKQLHEYRKGPTGMRNNPIMYAAVVNLTEADINNVALYLAEQKMSPGFTKKAALSRGQQLYRGGDRERGITACTACHAPQGEGNESASFPAISGQNPVYIVDQLKAFRQGTRSNDSQHIMQDIAKKLTDEDIDAVASYMSGLY